jgi:hypothetical protein
MISIRSVTVVEPNLNIYLEIKSTATRLLPLLLVHAATGGAVGVTLLTQTIVHSHSRTGRAGVQDTSLIRGQTLPL